MADKILGFLGDLVKPATGGGGNYVYKAVFTAFYLSFKIYLTQANIGLESR